MIFISVDFPDPDGPMIATISPLLTCRDTSLSTVKSIEPVLYVFTMLLTVITGVSSGVKGGFPAWEVVRNQVK